MKGSTAFSPKSIYSMHSLYLTRTSFVKVIGKTAKENSSGSQSGYATFSNKRSVYFFLFQATPLKQIKTLLGCS